MSHHHESLVSSILASRWAPQLSTVASPPSSLARTWLHLHLTMHVTGAACRYGIHERDPLHTIHLRHLLAIALDTRLYSTVWFMGGLGVGMGGGRILCSDRSASRACGRAALSDAMRLFSYTQQEAGRSLGQRLPTARELVQRDVDVCPVLPCQFDSEHDNSRRPWRGDAGRRQSSARTGARGAVRIRIRHWLVSKAISNRSNAVTYRGALKSDSCCQGVSDVHCGGEWSPRWRDNCIIGRVKCTEPKRIQ